MHTPHVITSLLVSAALGLGSQAQASDEEKAPGAERPLRIMLTNDDGVAGSGLLRLRDVLCAAGHQVFVSAPSADRSGTSGALSLNVAFRATRTQFMCGETQSYTWAVGGTPSDAVLFGLAMAGAEKPDLVISGMNSGQNVGRAVNHSGTVGAAVTAAEEGVPSIAVSIGLNFDDVGTGFSQTAAAAPHAAAYVKTLIDQLRETAKQGEGLLPDRVALNLNYPVVLNAEGLFDPALVQEPRVTVTGHGQVVNPQYLPIPNNPGVFFSAGSICGLQVPCAAETVRDADTTALAEGAISLTPLEVDGAANPQLRARIHARLRR
ncbi:MAG TPA: 5'/3'-nucleotidase SurE [Myxococcaceae bacterium]|jgi:5'-nucleotidase